jgi:putative oxidoreductase
VKIAVLVARILLGLIFCLFGSNGFFSFLPAQLPPGVAGQFLGSLLTSHYVYLIAATQLLSGILLLINRYVVLALALLAPVIANIVMYHITMQPAMAQLACGSRRPISRSILPDDDSRGRGRRRKAARRISARAPGGISAGSD